MSQTKPVTCVVACLLPKYGIGSNGTLPWKLSKEMKYFRQVTTAVHDSTKINAVIMGRKTWESIPPKFRPLPGRLNVVVSRAKAEDSDNVIRRTSIAEAVSYLQSQDKVEHIYIIGGGEVYNQSVRDGLVDNLLITEVFTESSPEMDTFFECDLNRFDKIPHAEFAQWLPQGVDVPSDDSLIEQNGFKFRYVMYKKH